MRAPTLLLLLLLQVAVLFHSSTAQQIQYNVGCGADGTCGGDTTYVITGGPGQVPAGSLFSRPNPTIYASRAGQAQFVLGADIATHPFSIKSVAGAGTDNRLPGVVNQGATTGNVLFTPSATTPDVVFYQCESHAAMNGRIEVGEAVLDATVVNPAGTEGGAGAVSCSFDTTSNTLTWSIRWTAAAFNPAITGGSFTDVTGNTFLTDITTSIQAGTARGTATVPTAQAAAYANVVRLVLSSTLNPAGELSAQVTCRQTTGPVPTVAGAPTAAATTVAGGTFKPTPPFSYYSRINLTRTTTAPSPMPSWSLFVLFGGLVVAAGVYLCIVSYHKVPAFEEV